MSISHLYNHKFYFNNFGVIVKRTLVRFAKMWKYKCMCYWFKLNKDGTKHKWKNFRLTLIKKLKVHSGLIALWNDAAAATNIFKIIRTKSEHSFFQH